MHEHKDVRARKTKDTTHIRKPVKSLQHAAVNSTPVNAVPQVAHDPLKPPGRHLDTGSHSFKEPRFEHDFSHVRVHTDSHSPTPPKPINVLDPAITTAAVNTVIADEQAPVRQWLDVHTMTLHNMSMEQLLLEVKHNVPQAVKLADTEIQNLIQQWAKSHQMGIKQPEQPTTYDKIADAAIGAVSLVSNGVKVLPSPLETKISITGATTTLKWGNVDIEGTLGISRKVEISVAYRKLKFAAELTGKEWKLTLSFGADEIPDLDGVAKTFKEGEKSIRAIARDPSSLNDPQHGKNAQEALEGLSKIVQAAGQRFEISVGSVEGDESPGGVKKGGVQVMGKITLIKF